MKNIFIFLAVSISMVFINACHFSRKHESVYNTIEKKSLDSSAYTSWNLLQHDRLLEVSEEKFPNFYIYERKSKISNYKCSGCHEENLVTLKAKKSNLVHKDIKYFHTPLNVMTCVTCHNATNMDELHSTADKSIDFNRSYNLCGQCHQAQLKDWKGGAHGKRIGGWVAPRVSKTCVECHNPHTPRFGTKIPAYPAYLKKKRN